MTRWWTAAAVLVVLVLAEPEPEPAPAPDPAPVPEDSAAPVDVESNFAPGTNTDEGSVDKRAIISDSFLNSNDDGRFQLYVGTVDGVRRILFNEVEGGFNNVPTDVGGHGREGDPFGAYDDNTIVDPNQERGIFIPRPYRPKDERQETTTTTTTTTQRPTTRRPPPRITRPRIFPTRPPMPQQTAPPRQPPPAFRPQPQTQPPFRPQPRPQPQTPPPQVFRPQPPQPQPRPLQPFAPRPQQPFVPDEQQQLPQQPQPTFQQPQPTFQQPQPQPPPPPQPDFELTPPPPPPTTPAPNPFSGSEPGKLRTGVCPNSIFYISTPLTAPSRLSFTHFAVAVTVDQCARTCHEFNCAIAHYNPADGHCEFNPSTAFAIRNGQCPAWPSLHYRNNVVASDAIRIFCVTCQRPRRRPSSRTRMRVRQRASQAHSRRARKLRRPDVRTVDSTVSGPSAIAHGVIVQPAAVSANSRLGGLSTSSFVGLSSLAEGVSHARALRRTAVEGRVTMQEVPASRR